MSKPLLPLCERGKIALRDGYTGQYAKMLLPFGGAQAVYFANGQIGSFPGGTIAQYTGRGALGGTRKPNTFMKDCCTHLNI